jgi:hypothetical protein
MATSSGNLCGTSTSKKQYIPYGGSTDSAGSTLVSVRVLAFAVSRTGPTFEGESFRRNPVLMKPCSRVDNYAGTQHVALRIRYSGGKSAILGPDRGRVMQDAGYELPRIHLMRLSENSRTRLSKSLRTAEMGHKGPVLAMLRYQNSRLKSGKAKFAPRGNSKRGRGRDPALRVGVPPRGDNSPAPVTTSYASERR